MSSLLPTNNNAPIIERILSDPITFVKAKNPDLSNTKPSTYKTFYTSNKRSITANNNNKDSYSPSQDMTSVAKYSRPKPKSMAEAVAAYTGKKFPTKLEKKFEKRESNRLKKQAQLKLESERLKSSIVSLNGEEHLSLDTDDDSEAEETTTTTTTTTTPFSTSVVSEQTSSKQPSSQLSNNSSLENDLEASVTIPNVEEEDSSSDNDYQTADENEDEAGTSSGDSANEEDDNEVEEDEEEEDEDDDEEEDDDNDSMLGHSKLSDPEKEELEEDLVTINPIKVMSPLSNADNENGDVEEDEELGQNTPPTSPDNDASGKSSSNQHTYLPDDEFFQIDENYNDRGSNGSDRIYKNWRELKNLKYPLGLVNQGVTCYMNAAVQALIHTPAVQHYLTDVHNNKYSNTIPMNSVTKTFADTSAKIWQLDNINNNNNRKVSMINPRKLIRRLDDINCMMSEWQQEDSHEYFMSLMSRLQEDSTPKGHKLNESIMYDIFGGLLYQSVLCQNCGHVSNTEQEFYDLSLNLDNKRRRSSSLSNGNNSNNNNNDDKDNNNNNNNNNNQHPDLVVDDELISRRYSIKKSLNDFFSPELIKTDQRDKSGYVCEKCKQRTNALKHNKIKRAPETLAIHLKRFRFNGTSSSKLKTGVSFPSSLDLTSFTVENEPSRYKLISVVVHEGRSVSSGHYIAQCRQPDGSWCVYDDEYINKTTEKEVLKNTSAYFLIYTRLTHKSKQSDWDDDVEERNNDKKRKSSKGNASNKRQKN